MPITPEPAGTVQPPGAIPAQSVAEVDPPNSINPELENRVTYPNDPAALPPEDVKAPGDIPSEAPGEVQPPA